MKKNSTFSFDQGNFYPVQDKHVLTPGQMEVVEKFHSLYFDLLEKKSGLQISWLGHQTGKTPFDLWVYQELIVKNTPDLIIETGTHWGGSAVFLSTICNLIGSGEVLSIDLYPKESLPQVDRLQYIHGSSIDDGVVKIVQEKCKDKSNVMVVLDSNHETAHVLEELRIYSEFVPVNGLIIVEDTYLNGYPSHPAFGPGPSEAIDLFLNETNEFEMDKSLEKFLFTLNRNGFLRRKK